MFNNNSEEKMNPNQIIPSYYEEFIQKPFNEDFCKIYFNQQKNNIFIFENIKNIFQEETLSLNESDDEENEKSIYFIKKQDNLETQFRSTDNSTNNSALEQDKIPSKKNETSIQKKINFKTFLRKKRGKKANPENSNFSKKCHRSDDFDNIQRKIQVHYISFLVSLANDKVEQFFGEKSKYHFKDVKYELKRIVNHKHVEYLKSCKYSDIMQMKISPKNKKFGEDTNKNIYLETTQLSKELKNFFDKNYLYIFQKYYLGLKPNEKEINYEGEKLALSAKTKGYYHLLRKNGFSKKFNGVVKDVYFTGNNYSSDKKFMTTDLNI
jgi:hypothetical protein